ncbi:hypothetical protein [Herbaspirillum huttiense]|uniref:hypothetical protein n=1 Tax=Herbaspirillum huttiense TaxID=863372 RepID=UPI0039AEF537
MNFLPRFQRGIALCISATMTWSAYAGQCGFSAVFQQKDEQGTRTVEVFRGNPVAALNNSRPLLFITSLKVNTDGTRISYHQDDVTGRRCETDPAAVPCAINDIRNAFIDPKRPLADFEALRDAGYPLPKTWKVLSADIIEKNKATGKPCISPDGYLVSMTSDVAIPGGFAQQGDCNQAKWIDALTIPALVLPKKSRFFTFGVSKRSTVIAISPSQTGHIVPGIVGDLGPVDELGEASVAMNRALNGLPQGELPKHRADANTRFQTAKTAILIFPEQQAILARPITASRVAENGTKLLQQFGGAEKIYACIKQEIDPSF